METDNRFICEGCKAALGNFLSGMETNRHELLGVGGLALGNFLSGMETSLLRKSVSPLVSPWKLP